MAVKKLIEVALPLEGINKAATREKLILHGNPSTMHMWWARRPIAATRAVIWASLVDDPSSHPEIFPTVEEQKDERDRLFRILENLVIWENSNDQDLLAEAKAEIQKSMGSDVIELIDPFAGGGAIPFEAQRFGLRAHAHDLNPVAVTINRAMIDLPARFRNMPPINQVSRETRMGSAWTGAMGLAEDVEHYGQRLKQMADAEIGEMYPDVDIPHEYGGGKAQPMAWLWTRTVPCPNPACGCTVPLAGNFELSKKRGKEHHVALDYQDKDLVFTVHRGKSNTTGTVNRSGGTCPKCGAPIQFDYIRDYAREHGFGNKLEATVVQGKRTRIYISPDPIQEQAAMVPEPDGAPVAQMPDKALGFRVQAYGMTQFKQLHTNRQLTMLVTLTGLVKAIEEEIVKDAIEAGLPNDGMGLENDGHGALAYAQAIETYLAMVIDKLVDYHSTICIWHRGQDSIANTMRRQAIPMTWDYVEGNPFCHASGSFDNMLAWVVDNVKSFIGEVPGIVAQADAAQDCGLRNLVVSTDPPYYDNIGYADLSDYFYIWLRRSIRHIYPQLFSTMLVPKAEELIATPFRFDGSKQRAKAYFEDGMSEVCKRLYAYARDDIPITVFYAFKQKEADTGKNGEKQEASSGWETMLNALISSGFSITGTWPMRTELVTALKGKVNALATSVVLVCRKRSKDAPMVTRRDFVNALKRELKPALDKLQTSNIAPVDLAQSAIGPGIAVYSRFSTVLEADGSQMTVRAALQIINQELDLYFSDQDNDLDRESRFCVDLYMQSAFNEIRFGEADVLARAKNTSIEGIAAKGALSSLKGVVRLLGRDEIRDMPSPDFCWLFTQQLTRAMEIGGIEDCAKMLKDVYDSRAENAKALAYRLFTIADKKGWAQEAFAYNSLVVAWPDIQTRAAQLQQETPVQTTLDI